MIIGLLALILGLFVLFGLAIALLWITASGRD